MFKNISFNNNENKMVFINEKMWYKIYIMYLQSIYDTIKQINSF